LLPGQEARLVVAASQGRGQGGDEDAEVGSLRRPAVHRLAPFATQVAMAQTSPGDRLSAPGGILMSRSRVAMRPTTSLQLASPGMTRPSSIAVWLASISSRTRPPEASSAAWQAAPSNEQVGPIVFAKMLSKVGA